jgi:phosphotransferase system enzyme I (PtsP)
MALIALGFRIISMPPSAIGPVKEMIRALDLGRLRARLLPRLEPGAPPTDVRALLGAFADEQNIPL